MMNKENGKDIYIFVRRIIPAFLLTAAIQRIFESEIGIGTLFLIAIVSMLLITIIEKSEHKIKLYSILAIICIIVILCAAFQIRGYVAGTFEIYVSITLAFCVAGFHAEYYFRIKVIIMIVMGVAILYLGTTGKENRFIVILAVLFYIMDMIIQICQRQMKVCTIEYYGSMFLLPITIFLILLVLLLPSGKQPLDWSGVKSFVLEVVADVSELGQRIFAGKSGHGDKTDFSVAMTGYNDENSNLMGGILKKSNEPMMRIRKDTSIMEPIYLTGTIRNRYLSDRWITDLGGKADNNSKYRWDLYENLYYMYQGGIIPNENEALLNEIKFELIYQDINTKSAFRPGGCIDMGNAVPLNEILQVGDNLKFREIAKYKTEYSLSAIEINFNNAALAAYLKDKEPSKVSEEEKKLAWEETMGEFRSGANIWMTIQSEDFASNIRQRKTEIYDYYLQLPDALPKRVYELAEEITIDATTDYEKAEAIKDYLKSYQYTTSMEEAEEGRDIVDQFLFEQKEGYCTYFASSMVVLCRCLGIPARYVEGVRADCNGKVGSWYVVRAAAAHAWTEVYIEDYGWMKMEATPSYEDSVATGSDMWKQFSKAKENRLNQYQTVQMNTPQQRIEEKVELTNQEESEKRFENWIYIVAGIVIVFFAILMFILNLLILKFKKNREYEKADDKKKVIMCMKDIIAYVHYLGYDVEDNESLFVIFERNRKRNEEDANAEIVFNREIFEWYIKIRFSKEKVDKVGFSKIKDYRTVLRELCVKQTNKVSLLLYERKM